MMMYMIKGLVSSSRKRTNLKMQSKPSLICPSGYESSDLDKNMKFVALLTFSTKAK